MIYSVSNGLYTLTLAACNALAGIRRETTIQINCIHRYVLPPTAIFFLVSIVGSGCVPFVAGEVLH